MPDYHVNNNFDQPQNINNDFNKIIIYYFYKSINDN